MEANERQQHTGESSGGRIPPQAVEIERAVLGAMLIDREALPKALEALDDTSFYNPTHQKYYNAMVSLFEKGDPVDSITLVEELRRRGHLNPAEDPVYITQLTMNVSSSANVEYHARIVLEKALKRGLIATSSEVASRAYNETEDALDLLDEAEARIFQISERRLKKTATPIKRALSDTFELLQTIHGQHGGVTGVPSGFLTLDDLTGGFQNSDLVIIAGRPSQGKTAFALAVARNAAIDRIKPTAVAIFSIEMAEQQLAIRMLASEAKVDAHKLRTGRLPDDEWTKLSRSVGRLAQAKIFIDDTPALGILELRAKARRMKAEHNVGLVIVDYLQLIQGPKSSESREREISMISRSLKALAKEINIPVLALSQLNRAVEGRSDKRPVLSDLRESGAIEQDADVVLFVHRPETYLPKDKDSKIEMIKGEDGNEYAMEGLAEIIIGKQRNGPTGTAYLHFHKAYAGFEKRANIAWESLAPPSAPTILPDNVPF